MSSLGRRLDALEEIVEEMRLGMSVEELCAKANDLAEQYR